MTHLDSYRLFRCIHASIKDALPIHPPVLWFVCLSVVLMLKLVKMAKNDWKMLQINYKFSREYISCHSKDYLHPSVRPFVRPSFKKKIGCIVVRPSNLFSEVTRGKDEGGNDSGKEFIPSQLTKENSFMSGLCKENKNYNSIRLSFVGKVGIQFASHIHSYRFSYCNLVFGLSLLAFSS